MGWDGIKLPQNQTPADYVRRDIEAAGNAVLYMHATGDAVYAAVQVNTAGGLDQAGDVIGLVVAVRCDRGYTLFKWMQPTRRGPPDPAAPATPCRRARGHRAGPAHRRPPIRNTTEEPER